MHKSFPQYLAENLEKSTVKNYLYEIKKYRTLNRDTENYHYRQVMEYVEMLRKNYRPPTLTRVVSALKQYYGYLMETGYRQDNPAAAIRLRDAKENPVQLQDLLCEKELLNLMHPRKERYPFLTQRNRVIMSLLVCQALKPGEIIQLKTNDINPEKAQIKITGTAQTNHRILPLKAQQILLLYNYIQLDRNRNHKDALLLSKIGTPVTVDDISYLYQCIKNKRIKNSRPLPSGRA